MLDYRSATDDRTPNLLKTSRKWDRHITFACAAGLVAVFGYYLVYIFIRIGHKNTEGEFHYGDFATFYHAALDVLSVEIRIFRFRKERWPMFIHPCWPCSTRRSRCCRKWRRRGSCSLFMSGLC